MIYLALKLKYHLLEGVLLISIQKPKREDVPVLIDLFTQNYNIEKEAVNELPIPTDLKPLLELSFSRWIEKGYGVVAFEDDLCVGYLFGIPIGPLFGNDGGIVMPLHGHGTIVKNRKEIYASLYQFIAPDWVRNKHTSHAIVLFSHDDASIAFWFQNGFGKRCVDAIKKVEPKINLKSEAVIQKVKEADLSKLTEIHHLHNLYYRQTPMFMPTDNEDAFEDLKKWFAEENHHLWYATSKDEVVGYMRIQPNGESIVSYLPTLMNITGAYVKENHRDKHVGSLLLGEILNWLNGNNYSFLGVDYESINPSAMKFWEKHFKSYTVTLTRRIDERINTV